MTRRAKRVSTVDDLIAAASDKEIREIVVSADLADLPSISLLPGQTLHSDSVALPTVTFRRNVDGVRLSSDNTVAGVHLITSPEKRAIWNDYSAAGLGTISLRSVRTTGRVQILAKERVGSGHIEVDGLEIDSADPRAEKERPQDYGVYVLRGAFTLWNMQADHDAASS